MTQLILASASATRARLLAAAGVSFQAAATHVDEAVLKHEFVEKGYDAVTTARSLAAAKAYSLAPAYPDTLVLGADQVLNLDGELISKCESAAEACLLLGRLRGRTHELVTAAVLARNGLELWSHVNTSRMTMRAFSDEFMQKYVESAGAALVRNVGCYEFEGPGAQLFARMQGDYFSVLGLPLLPVLAVLRVYGVIAE